MRVARPSRRIDEFIAIVFALMACAVLASCGVEEGYESLEVRYEGVPINLEAAVEGAPDLLTTDAEETAVSDGTEPATLSYTDEDEPVDGSELLPADIPESPIGDEIERQAHWEPLPDEDPAAVSEISPDELPEGIEVAEADANSRNRRRALRSFRGLVANATTLGSRSVNCIVAHVDNSGVNPVPMNRVLRRALSGRTQEPSQRYVALAYDAANACGVELSDSLLR